MKTSSLVIAALFASCSAVKRNSLSQLQSGTIPSPQCPDAESWMVNNNDRIHPACFGLAQQESRTIPSPQCPEAESWKPNNDRIHPACFGLLQLDNRFATGMAGDEDLGADIIMKGDKFHYNQLRADPGAPPHWKAYEDKKAAEEEPKKDDKPLPLCRGHRFGEVPGVTCKIFVTSTPPGQFGNTLTENEKELVMTEDFTHPNAAHITTDLGDLPTCMGADGDIPETNCTNRAAPICNADGTNGIPNVSCTPPMPVCNGFPGTNGHPGVDCIPGPLPTCGTEYGGQAGRDCTVRLPGAAVTLAIKKYNLIQLPTCSDRLTVNCQPVCTESETTGCTESRTPVPLPMRTWDWRDRFEGRKTQLENPENAMAPQ